MNDDEKTTDPVPLPSAAGPGHVPSSAAQTEACEQHSWGEAEECETSLGVMWSPTCKHCGAVKLELERRARARAEVDRRLAAAAEVRTPLPPAGDPGLVPAPARLATNIPPAGVAVHPFQTEIFTDV